MQPLDLLQGRLHGRPLVGDGTGTIGMRWAALLLSCAFAAVALPADARQRGGREEVVPAEARVLPYDGHIPGCQDTRVLAWVASKFAEKEAKFWPAPRTITAYEDIRRVAWRPWGIDYIPRRFCTATVWTSDGVKRRIDYSVREDLGIGPTWGMHLCVVGLDRNFANAPACRMARP
jgi:hypothetical protein